MLVDYYGMPSDPKKGGWPGRSQASGLKYPHKAVFVQTAITADIQAELGKKWDARRFISFVIMHEFEGLLFSDCQKFAEGIGRTDLAANFQAIRKKFKSPEEINDSPATHPSQRVLELVPGYQKPLYGNLAALEIGFEPMRSECPHFRAWLERLEQLV